MSVQRRRKYDSECKKNAVLLTEEVDRSVRDVAEKIGRGYQNKSAPHKKVIKPTRFL